MLTRREIERFRAMAAVNDLDYLEQESEQVAETCLHNMDRADVAEEALAKSRCWHRETAVTGRCGTCPPCLAFLAVAARKEQGDEHNT